MNFKFHSKFFSIMLNIFVINICTDFNGIVDICYLTCLDVIINIFIYFSFKSLFRSIFNKHLSHKSFPAQLC